MQQSMLRCAAPTVQPPETGQIGRLPRSSRPHSVSGPKRRSTGDPIGCAHRSGCVNDGGESPRREIAAILAVGCLRFLQERSRNALRRVDTGAAQAGLEFGTVRLDVCVT